MDCAGVHLVSAADGQRERLAARCPVKSLLADETVKTEFVSVANQARRLFKAVLPDSAAADHQASVAVLRVQAERRQAGGESLEAQAHPTI